MIPQTNCLISKVTGGAVSEDWDTSAGAGSNVWTGSMPAYFRENRERVTGETADLVLRRSLIVQTDERDWAEGEIVTFRMDGGAEQTGQVKMIEARSLPGLPSGIQTTRLTLTDA